MNEKRIGALAIIIAAALWGVDQIVIRSNLFHIENVATMVFVEHLVAFLIMSTFCWYYIHEVKKLNLKDWSSFFWVSLFGGAIGTMAIVKALMLVQFDHLSIVALLQKLQPIFAIILAMVLLKEVPKKMFWFWSGVAFVASYFVTFGFGSPQLNLDNNVLLAALYAILAAFAFGSSTTFGKFALKKVSFWTATYIRFGLTTIITFLIVIFTNSFSFFSRIGTSDIGWFLVIAFTSGGFGMFIYYYGLKRVLASRATIYELTYPATAILLDYVVNGHGLSIGQWSGTIVLVFAIYKVVRLR